jgi:hypothetical protein
MHKTLALAFLLLSSASSFAAEDQSAPAAHKVSLDRPNALELVGAKAEFPNYQGRQAVKLVPSSPDSKDDMLAIVRDSDFQSGTLEVDVAGTPRPGSPADDRGFIGLAFRVQPDSAHYEMFYLRPTNGRANDQLRRNHTTQYVSEPEYPWHRLRSENPGVYESYVDVEAGAWTHLKIVVAGKQARLYVNGGPEPCLIVNELKQGEGQGRIALWAHVTTEAYFSNLSVSRE